MCQHSPLAECHLFLGTPFSSSFPDYFFFFFMAQAWKTAAIEQGKISSSYHILEPLESFQGKFRVLPL